MQPISQPDGFAHIVEIERAHDHRRGNILEAICGKRWRPIKGPSAASENPTCVKCLDEARRRGWLGVEDVPVSDRL